MTNSEQRRLNWRLKVLLTATTAGSVTRTCRRFGLSRKTFYKWRRRYHQLGETGLADRSRVPHHSPRATPAAVVSKILYLRQHYHFGPGKIADYLKRFHSVSVACASVHRILRRHGMNRLPANQKYRRHAHRWTRYEKAQPGHRLQVDVKFLERIAGSRRRFCQFTAIDDCTRIRVLKIYDACNQRTPIAFIDDVLRRLPFRVHVIQTDNGAEFQSHFHWHLQDLDVRHVYIRPRTPHLNGKVERSHRVDDQEFYQLLDCDGITDDIHLFNAKLKEWEDYYNYHRPHGALAGPAPVRTTPGKGESRRVTGVLRTYTLTTDERTELERRTRSRKGRSEDSRRAEVILMLANDDSFTMNAAALRCSPDYIVASEVASNLESLSYVEAVVVGRL